jgi:pyridinium-3,5-bisthiocarboxylic acid mononucleotide nickel chelatase
MRTLWIDASSGVSGDMLLGALVDLGVALETMQASIDLLGLPEKVVLSSRPVLRSGLGATKVDVDTGRSPHHHRHLADVVALLDPLPETVRAASTTVFRLLATAEAEVHRVPVEDVHFHEVGALDSIADVVAVVTGFAAVGAHQVVCSPLALGAGRTRSEHGSIPVPGPAVLELLTRVDVPAFGGPLERELATPTGVALAVTLADRFGPMPAMRVAGTGSGAGSWDPPGHANVVRIIEGIALDERDGDRTREVVVSANVDDLDPRLWPGILAELMSAGAADAWLTPILMKKGRPAHTVSVLVDPRATADIEQILVGACSTIGLRRHEVDKIALLREMVTVAVGGVDVRVKVARHRGRVVNVSPEHDDVVALAARCGLTEKRALAQAIHASAALWDDVDL